MGMTEMSWSKFKNKRLNEQDLGSCIQNIYRGDE